MALMTSSFYSMEDNGVSDNNNEDNEENHELQQLSDLYSSVDKSKKSKNTTPSGDLYSVVDKSRKTDNTPVDLYSSVDKSKKSTSPTGDLYSVVDKSKKSTNIQSDLYSTVDKSKNAKAPAADLYSIVDKSKKTSPETQGDLYSVVDKSKKNMEDTADLYSLVDKSKKPSDEILTIKDSHKKRDSGDSNFVKASNLPNKTKIVMSIAIAIIAVFFIAATIIVSILLTSSESEHVTKSIGTNTTADIQTPDESPTNDMKSSETPTNDITSCGDIPSQNLSGYYNITPNKESMFRVYCDMNLTCGDGNHGWMRVANITVNSKESCPQPWKFNASQMACSSNLCHTSVIFQVHGVKYSRVCGRVIGAATRFPNAFRSRVNFNTTVIPYDGIGFVQRISRKHIWAYVVGSSKNNSNCPCYNSSAPQPFVEVGKKYYCDQLVDDGNELWNQAYCGADANFTSSTLFDTNVEATTRDIEAIICTNQPIANENVFVKSLQLYVQ